MGYLLDISLYIRFLFYFNENALGSVSSLCYVVIQHITIVAEHVEFKPVPKREGQPTAVDEPGESHAEEEREAVQAF